MSKRFRICDLNQPYLMPPTLQDWLPERHLARFIADITPELDLTAIYNEYGRRDGRGKAAYHPEMMVRVLLYCYCAGLTSSRKIEKASYEDIAVRYLTADQHPDHDTIASFRERHLQRLGELFVQALQLCRKAGLVKLGNVALDGTKIQANASLNRSYPPDRLTKQEQDLQELVDKLLATAQQTDAAEDREYGKGQCEEQIPEQLANAKARLERIRKAKQELAEEANKQVAALKEAVGPLRKPGRPRKGEELGTKMAERKNLKKRLQRAERRATQPTRQYNFTDPESRVMRDNGRRTFVQGYNAQAAVDGEKQVIVAVDVVQDITDNHQLLPMCDRMKNLLGELPKVITADAGYWDTEEVATAQAGTQVLVAPDATHEQAKPRDCKPSEAVRKMRELLETPIAGAQYRLRKTIVEPVFGQIKEVRGLRKFAFRGLSKVQAEWNLIALTHNLLKLYRYDWLPKSV